MFDVHHDPTLIREHMNRPAAGLQTQAADHDQFGEDAASLVRMRMVPSSFQLA